MNLHEFHLGNFEKCSKIQNYQHHLYLVDQTSQLLWPVVLSTKKGSNSHFIHACLFLEKEHEYKGNTRKYSPVWNKR